MVREHIFAMTFTAVSFTHICVYFVLFAVYDIFWCYFVYEHDYLSTLMTPNSQMMFQLAKSLCLFGSYCLKLKFSVLVPDISYLRSIEPLFERTALKFWAYA